MKSIPILILSSLLLVNPATQAQPDKQLRIPSSQPVPDEPQPKFDIIFPGGTPQQLIDAIEKQSRIHVNAVIPDEYAKYTIPALKMNGITLKDLFSAIKSASQRTIKYVTGETTDLSGMIRQQYQSGQEFAGFQSVGNVWYFQWQKDSVLRESKLKVCRFYQLAPYLKGRKVEDITTAVQTGWKMLGETNLPELKFHQETQMLIAVGEESQLKLIDNVLEQLRFGLVPRGLPSDFFSPKPATNAPGR